MYSGPGGLPGHVVHPTLAHPSRGNWPCSAPDARSSPRIVPQCVSTRFSSAWCTQQRGPLTSAGQRGSRRAFGLAKSRRDILLGFRIGASACALGRKHRGLGATFVAAQALRFAASRFSDVFDCGGSAGGRPRGWECSTRLCRRRCADGVSPGRHWLLPCTTCSHHACEPSPCRNLGMTVGYDE